MWTVFLCVVLIWAVSKWMTYKLSVLAILLYYADCGIELPDTNTIQKYRLKVAMKFFHIKGD